MILSMPLLVPHKKLLPEGFKARNICSLKSLYIDTITAPKECNKLINLHPSNQGSIL